MHQTQVLELLANPSALLKDQREVNQQYGDSVVSPLLVPIPYW